MQYRELGKTGLKLSSLSFGASSLGGVFADIVESEGIRTVQVAVDHGINLLDVSPYYGLTKAETVLGKALKNIPRDKYILSTKVGRYGSDFKDFDFSAGRVTRSVDESLARLNVDHIDIILCHDIEFGDLAQIINQTLPALRKLQQTGKVKYVGISGLPIKPLKYVVEQAPVDVVLSYCHYELNDTALLDLLPTLEKKGVGIINASPLGMGLLSTRPLPSWHPAPTKLREAAAKAAELCAHRGTPIEKLAVQFAVANPQITTTLVGTADPNIMLQNIATVDEPMDEQLLMEVSEILRPVHNMTWVSGHAENN